ncbi:MAG: ATP-grasp domain-containing protein [Candidatus Hydrogenedentes bacterium]|nr:ATP-grasp domain-containing protein [Candidatus Hydrogenedentota bacterium]
MAGSPARVLVVGTTPDYVDWLRRVRPGDCVFVTDIALRRDAHEPPPQPDEEIVCDLVDSAGVGRALTRHLDQWALRLDGVACFDCESLELAATLAPDLGLPFVSVEAVRRSRDKHAMKAAWRAQGVPCPAAALVRSAADVAGFMRQIGAPCVLKPTCGSGSEFVFPCAGPEASAAGFEYVEQGVQRRSGHRLYRPVIEGAEHIVAEELVTGHEYSCDFLVEDGWAEIIRLTRKLGYPDGPFGTTRAYELVPDPEAMPWAANLVAVAREAATALGISRSICMMDFMLRDGTAVVLELTPRPGGDCLPLLLRTAAGLDMLQFAVEFARGRPPERAPMPKSQRYVGLRLLADREGTLSAIDAGRLRQDPRVRQVEVLRRPGTLIRTPPNDFDSWVLGHVVFVPSEERPLAEQCDELAGLLSWKVVDGS